MTNREFGRAYIEDARVILAEADASLEQGHFHRIVRKCQESVEMALKGLLRVRGSSIRKLIGWAACCWSRPWRRWCGRSGARKGNEPVDDQRRSLKCSGEISAASRICFKVPGLMV